jgi:hypothetical protein
MVFMNKQKFINIVLLTIALVAIFFGGYFYYKLRVVEKSSITASQQEAQDLLSKVVLIFTKAGRAVLYRPSINKIIETAPISKEQKNPNAPVPETSTADDTKDKGF